MNQLILKINTFSKNLTTISITHFLKFCWLVVQIMLLYCFYLRFFFNCFEWWNFFSICTLDSSISFVNFRFLSPACIMLSFARVFTHFKVLFFYLYYSYSNIVLQIFFAATGFLIINVNYFKLILENHVFTWWKAK